MEKLKLPPSAAWICFGAACLCSASCLQGYWVMEGNLKRAFSLMEVLHRNAELPRRKNYLDVCLLNVMFMAQWFHM